MMSRPRGVDVTLEWCHYYGEFTSNSNSKLMSHSNAVPTTEVLVAHSNGVPTTEELMSLLNGVPTRGDLMTHSDGVPTTGVDVTNVITMCHFTQCLISLSPNR